MIWSPRDLHTHESYWPHRREMEFAESGLSVKITGLTIMNWSPRDLHTQ
jgi:hypothetical protein